MKGAGSDTGSNAGRKQRTTKDRHPGLGWQRRGADQERREQGNLALTNPRQWKDKMAPVHAPDESSDEEAHDKGKPTP